MRFLTIDELIDALIDLRNDAPGSAPVKIVTQPTYALIGDGGVLAVVDGEVLIGSTSTGYASAEQAHALKNEGWR